MTTIELSIRDLPADVQDILRDRAIKQRRPIGDVVRDYVLEVAKAIVAAAGTQAA
jgi:plasmid stability protein